MRCARREAFPVPQQWFATGEAPADLLYFEQKGRIARHWRDGTVYFSL